MENNESVSPPKLSTNESLFLKGLTHFGEVSIEQTPDYNRDMVLLRNKEYGVFSITILQKFLPGKTQTIDLSIIFLEYFHLAQRLIRELCVEDAATFVQRQNAYIIEVFRLTYRHHFKEEPSEVFLDHLDLMVYQTVCVGYSRKAVLQREREQLLQICYGRGNVVGALFAAKQQLQRYKHAVYSMDFLSAEQQKQLAVKIQREQDNIFAEFMENTKSPQKRAVTFLLLFVLFFVALITSVIVRGWLSLTLLGVVTTAVLAAYGMNANVRLFKPNILAKFKKDTDAELQELLRCKNKVIIQFAKRLEQQLKNNPELRILIRGLYLTYQYQLSLLKLTHKPRKTKPVLQDRVTVEAESPYEPVYEIENVMCFYTRRRERFVNPVVVEKRSEITVSQKVAWELQNRLSPDSCFVRKGSSRAVFDFSAEAENLPSYLRTAIREDNAFSFGRLQGQFGVFKSMGPKRYTFKYDKLRIDFEVKENASQMVKRGEEEKTVPTYQVLKVRYK